jgi:Fe-S-cluster containining protein
MHEYAAICHNYGYDALELGVGRPYLRKHPDGRCIFQFKQNSGWLCALQSMKPYVCKMWPFIVSRKPKYGREDDARWEYSDGEVYVYADPRCPRMIFGKPSRLTEQMLTEFSDIAFRRQDTQLHTTCNSLNRSNHLMVLFSSNGK